MRPNPVWNSRSGMSVCRMAPFPDCAGSLQLFGDRFAAQAGCELVEHFEDHAGRVGSPEECVLQEPPYRWRYPSIVFIHPEAIVP